MCVLALAIVSAVPAVDESVFGEVYDAESINPQDPQQFFKLKKLKKILFG